MAINKNSTSYIITFAVILISVTALLLSTLSISLKDAQTQNIENEKRIFILSAAGEFTIDEASSKSKQEIAEIFNKKIQSVVIDYKGKQVDGNAFNIDVVKEFKATSKNPQQRQYALYTYTNDEGKVKYIIPMAGNGLWGPVWAYVALKDDQNTIDGVVFDHKSETPGLGAEINGARAWIALPGGFQIQPAELAKIAIIIGMSMILSERTHDSNEPTSKDVLQALAIAAIPVILIILQPDMGTILIIAASVVTIIAVSGAPARWVVGLLLLAVLGGFVAVKAGVISEYQVNRLQTFVDPNADTQGAGYQLRQARITVGSGGLLGTGLFNGPQTNGRFVPEQQTDFIFTVAGEELGFIGSGFILLLYLILLMRAFSIARRTSDPFGRLVCMGVIAWFSFQLFENIGMTLGLMPMTGVPLPFISYGGSSMFATLIGFGLLQNVHARLRG